MMWIESYKAGGKKYYRVIMPGEKPVHLGTADVILRKVRPELGDIFAKRTKNAEEPTKKAEGVEAGTHEPDDLVFEGGVNE